MAQLNRLQFVVVDQSGNAISGATVKILRQGATVNGTQAGPAYVVDDPGSITTSDSVYSSINQSFTRAVTAVTVTQVTCGAIGLGTLNNGDRILVASSLATIYADSVGNATVSNPLTTDANGRASCWINASKVDVIYSATGYSTWIEYDRAATNAERFVSNQFPGGAGPIAHLLDTSRNMTTGKLRSWQNAGVEKANLDYTGVLTCTGVTNSGNESITGNLSVSGTSSLIGAATLSSTLAVTGATTLTGALGAQAGTFSGLLTANNSFTYSGVAGSFTLTSGSVATGYLANQATMQTVTGLGTADIGLNAAAYAVGNYDASSGKGSDITGATVTFTPFSSSSEIVVMGQFYFAATGAAGTFYGAIRDGTGTVLAEGSQESYAVNNLPSSMSVMYRTTGISAATTFKLSAQADTNLLNIKDSTNSANKRVCRIIVMEFKK